MNARIVLSSRKPWAALLGGLALGAGACGGDAATIIGPQPVEPAGSAGSSSTASGGSGGTASGGSSSTAAAGAGGVAEAGAGGGSGAGGSAPVAADAGAPPASTGTYAVGTLVFGPEGTLGYVNLLDSLEPQTLDLNQAREFSGTADLWVYDGAVFVSNDESFTITKYAVEDGGMVEQGVVSFANYGIPSFGFWLNTFVSPTKAYYLNDTLEYIVWDPSTMTITGTVELPEQDAVDGFELYTSYSDRAAQLRNGLLYQPFYYTDESFFLYAPESRITVLDVATDSFVDVLSAPCPGLDYSTADEAGNLYFSSWVYAAGGAAVLDQPATCAFQVPAQGEPGVAFDFASLSDGRQGAAMRYVGDGKALISILHDERFAEGEQDAAALTFANNWRFWLLDIASGTAAQVDSIDWNAGAQYSFDIDQRTYMLVAQADYSATTIFDITGGQTPAPVFDTIGWATRLFKVR